MTICRRCGALRAGLEGTAMPFRAPSAARMPPLHFLLADQMELPKRIARHLGVSLRSLQRWRARGDAPRAVCLALWFESRWGWLNCTRRPSTKRSMRVHGWRRWSANASGSGGSFAPMKAPSHNRRPMGRFFARSSLRRASSGGRPAEQRLRSALVVGLVSTTTRRSSPASFLGTEG